MLELNHFLFRIKKLLKKIHVCARAKIHMVGLIFANSYYRTIDLLLNMLFKRFPRKQPIGANPILTAIKKQADLDSILVLLSNKPILSKIFCSLDKNLKQNYLYKHFASFLSMYISESTIHIQDYFSGKQDLTFICNDFIGFCFKKNISLDPSKTLISFKNHNKLSDNAIKKELLEIKPKEHFNLLGFGLDEGIYEKELAQFLITKNIAKTVTIYGLDPYAKQDQFINYITAEQLNLDTTPKFDLIISRWALHHVELQHRWKDFIKSIIHSNTDALVLAIEHGFLNKTYSSLDERFYYLINATFDILANIGLRPRYFTSTAPNIGVNFFIQYLYPEDFKMITDGIPRKTIQHIYEVGPGFPNQTIYSLHIN